MIEYRRRRPPLYRLARYLRWSSVLALLLVLMFLVSTVVSAVEFVSHAGVSSPGGHSYSFGYSASTGFTATFAVNLTNHGYYPLVLDLSAFANTAQGPLISYASTGEVTIPAGNRTTTFGLTLHVPESTLAAHGASMLVNNTPFAGDLWLNGTYAWIYRFGLAVTANGSWGAPFENLSVQPGTPSEADGETTVPVAVEFRDNALFADTGNLSFQVVDQGNDCGAPTALSLDTPAGQNFSGEVNLTAPSSCFVPGATVAATYTLGSLSFPLPSARFG